MGKEYYTLNQIKVKFRSYRNPKESVITDDEYKRFCGELQYLPKTIIKRAHDEIHFVLMSANPETGTPACYVNLRKGIDLKKKKGIVVLSPHFFGAPYCDKKGNLRIYTAFDHGYPILLEEIAHHFLNHSYEKSIQIDETEAMDKVKEWMHQFREFQSEE